MTRQPRMEWSNEDVLEFLDVYQQEPVIWCTRHPERRNKIAVSEAWANIQRKLSFDCPVTDLKKKKESLMTTFRSIFKQTAKASAAGIVVSKPTWFAYEKMESFLGEIYESKNWQDESYIQFISVDDCNQGEVENGDLIDSDTETAAPSEKEDSDIEKFIETINPTAKINASGKKHAFPESKRTFKRRRTNAVEEPINESPVIFKTEPVDKTNTDKVCSLYGELIAQKLVAFDDDTRAVVMNEIDNYLFRAQMNQRRVPTMQNSFTSFSQIPSIVTQSPINLFTSVPLNVGQVVKETVSKSTATESETPAVTKTDSGDSAL